MTTIASPNLSPLFMSRHEKLAHLSPSAFQQWETEFTAEQTRSAYDGRGRLLPFVETSAQRRARVEMLRKKQSARKITLWLQTNSEASSKASSPTLRSLRTVEEEEEVAESEVVYSTSPGTLAWASPSLPAQTQAQVLHLRQASRSSSLSSISEDNTEDSSGGGLPIV